MCADRARRQRHGGQGDYRAQEVSGEEMTDVTEPIA
jgi:hypothetical protein